MSRAHLQSDGVGLALPHSLHSLWPRQVTAEPVVACPTQRLQALLGAEAWICHAALKENVVLTVRSHWLVGYSCPTHLHQLQDVAAVQLQTVRLQVHAAHAKADSGKNRATRTSRCLAHLNVRAAGTVHVRA